ncbi:bifunctional diaminohydroxyphosphoribosylaminopyrimidine deaminase/5-amino-6-(5-phosphoribosylamino)uracil reductase RibD [Streptomyces sp. WMMC500]|uniref:bifunctional diaminohydroxyphosphoribosylaminopyrimidine deaminase/5-amino-6-(5-phosphoribosylamino)uracil reductase RibD n=1 Tax=Streptomyces sp. WMMC500 TaxID=3015154 RepID=UPI00248C1288|nr:bifunctional diaminohydroxyphosphoribosylaminopyrimidine deaminase/5-amino-6-(5-phosphoribosylamino)uracil reductase RibD [Streptomyces sp. WMMC500]WBB64788.1 bifunctional diaminohydroxyphosphoribosylaminopyrimidine deaminase/5-amino-6-(5-phosphoribosylamino)uracil reductase RibD [Streptomyces sp. WMMC500]
MRRAIALASRALGDTSPNPVVGCVILDAAGQPAGEGHHARAGGPHAEVAALADAGERARGGTAVVTLEPCSHTGRTGPCVRALADAGVARVVYAVADPTPAAGGGAAALAAAGIEVEGGLLADEAAAGNEPWLTSALRGRPYVLWKYAATLDGRSAAADGTSRWITSPAARADVHRLRAEADAVVVGSGTLRADDPQLAVRGPRAEAGATQPLRVVADTEGTALTPGARILDGAAPTLVAVAADAAMDRLTAVLGAAAARGGHRAEVVRLPRAAGGRGLDVAALLAALYGRDVRSVLLEGGPTLAGAFLAAGVVDRVVCYLAPVLLGAGPAALADAGIGTIGEALRLDVTAVDHLGPDLRLTAVPGPAPEPPATKES